MKHFDTTPTCDRHTQGHHALAQRRAGKNDVILELQLLSIITQQIKRQLVSVRPETNPRTA